MLLVLKFSIFMHVVILTISDGKITLSARGNSLELDRGDLYLVIMP